MRGEGGREQREKLNESERKTEELETESGKVSVSSQIIDLQYIIFFKKNVGIETTVGLLKKEILLFFLFASRTPGIGEGILLTCFFPQL